jgi:hypothetical protein
VDTAPVKTADTAAVETQSTKVTRVVALLIDVNICLVTFWYTSTSDITKRPVCLDWIPLTPAVALRRSLRTNALLPHKKEVAT